jgi:hypothetical protein
LFYAWIGLITSLLWWPLLTALGIISRRVKGDDVIAVWICAGIFCLVLAMRKAWNEQKAGTTLLPTQTPRTQPSTRSPSPQLPRPTANHPVPPVVASRIRTKYHRPSCRWAARIDRGNRVTFASSADARRRGLRPCGECHPT